MPDLRSVTRRGSRIARSYRSRLLLGRTRRQARALTRSGLVQEDWITLQTGRAFRSGEEAALWFLAHGFEQQVSPHRLVEPSLLPGSGPDSVVRVGRDPRLLRRHPLLAQEDAPSAVLARLHPETHLQARTVTTTYGAWRELVDAQQVMLLDQQSLIGRRISTRWDGDADSAYVARWSDVSVASPGQPVVSVIMPVRNRPRLVADAIRSVQAQTLESWELLVVDDGSTDDTADAVAAIARTDPRVRLIQLPAQGVCAARNAGLDSARGEYVAFLDSDNSWVPQFLHVMIASMQHHDVDAAYAVVDEVGDNGRHRYRTMQVDARSFEAGNAVDLNVLVARAERLREIGGFDTTLRRMVDYDLAWRLARSTTLRLMPFVGVRYSNATSGEGADRISRTEAMAWDDVVKIRNLVDWVDLRAELADREADTVSSIVVGASDVDELARTVEDVLRATDGDVVVAGSAVPMPAWRHWAAEVGLDPRVTLVRSPGPLNRAALIDLSVPRTRGTSILAFTSGSRVHPDLVETLLAPLRKGAAAAHATGSGLVMAADLPALVQVGGLDPLFSDEFEAEDLALRLGQQGMVAATVALSAAVMATATRPSPRHSDNVREWRRRWPDEPLPGGTA